jgi:hypothetical protein
MPEDRVQKPEISDDFWVWVFFRLSINEAGLEFGAWCLLTSGFWVLTSAGRHRLHIPFPIENAGIRSVI